MCIVQLALHMMIQFILNYPCFFQKDLPIFFTNWLANQNEDDKNTLNYVHIRMELQYINIEIQL